MKNNEKWAVYKDIHRGLKKALVLGFDIQAIVYEYAILEDRIDSILRYFNRTVPSNDRGLNKRINILRSGIKDKLLRKYIKIELLDLIEKWAESRNEIIHALAKKPFTDIQFKTIALEGDALIKSLSRKSTLLKKAIIKRDRTPISVV